MSPTLTRPEIVRRQVDIDFDDLPPLPWRPGAAGELWLKAGSLIFPRGERFFIDAVRACQDRATDPILRQQIRDFIHQEAMHGKVHSQCNDALAREYPGARRLGRCINMIVDVFDSLPRGFRLSITTATEHLTAIAADSAFRHEEEFRQVMPKEFVDLCVWHAAEETEHKAVCFDLHRVFVGGGVFGYLHRIAGMLVATVSFLGGTLAIAALLHRGPHRSSERGLPKRRGSRHDKWFETGSLLRFTGQIIPWRAYCQYFRPSFHPWQHDNSNFVKEWRERYPGFGLA